MREVSATHTDLAELAAFVDGRLEGPRRQRVVEHLASCPDCRHLFSDTARLIDEEELAALGESERPREARRLLSGPWRKTIATSAAIAATLALVVISPRILDRLQGGPGGSLGSLAADLTEPAPGGRLPAELLRTWQSHDWPRQRSAEAPSFTRQEARSFQLGVRVMELEVALRSDQGELAQRLTYRLESLLGEDDVSEQVRVLYASEQGVRGNLEAGFDPASLTPHTARAADLLAAGNATEGNALVDPFWFELGSWTRAAQLAAATGRADFFEQRAQRRYLESLEERLLPTAVATPVRRLVALSGEEPAGRLPEIERELRELLTVAGGGTPSGEAP